MSSSAPPPPLVGGGWTQHGSRTPPRHKRTCDFCCQRKRKCDGDGRGSCSFCLARGTICHYSSRRPNRPRASSSADAGGGENSGSGSDGVSTAGIKLDGNGGWLGKRAMTEQRQPVTFAALKRARLGASMATGLVHTKENLFLGTFFDSLGFLPLVDESQIRQAIMETMLASRSRKAADGGQASVGGGLHQRGSETSDESAVAVATRAWTGAGARPGEGQTGGTPLMCTLWCAIAIGALVQGQPPHTVVPYARLAWKALSDCFDHNTAEAARAYMMMAYLYNFLRDDIKFCNYLRCAVTIVDRLEPGEAAAAQDMEALLMRGDETRSYHTIEQCPWELKGYQLEGKPALQVPTFIVKRTLCNFLFEADKRMYAAFLRDQKALLPPPKNGETSPGDGGSSSKSGGGGGGGGGGSGAGRGAAVVVGTSVVGEKARPARQQGSSWEVIQEWIPLFARMEEAAELPEIGDGVGGLLYNGVHAYIEMAIGNTMVGFNKITRSAEVLIRYPGLCRFSVWLHLSHCLLAFLSAFKSEETFGKLRDAYNKVRAQGTAAVPTYSEWTTVGFCNHIFCRAIDERLRKKSKPAVEVSAEGEEIDSKDQHQHENQNQPNPSDQHQHQHQHQHHREGGAHRATPSPPPLPPQASIPNEAVSAQDVPGQTATRNYQTVRQVEGLRSPQPLYGVGGGGGGGGKAKEGLPGVANLCASPDNDASCVAGATVTQYGHAVASTAGISTAAGFGVGTGTPAADGGGGGGRGGGAVRPSSIRGTERGYREGDWRRQTSSSQSSAAAAFPENYVMDASPPVSFSGLPAGFVVEPSPPASFPSGLATEGGHGRLLSWPKESTPALPAASAAEAGAATTVPAMVVPVRGFHGGASYDAGDRDGDGRGIGVGGNVTTADAAGVEWVAGGSRSRDTGGRECRPREATGPRDAFSSDWMGSGAGGGW